MVINLEKGQRISLKKEAPKLQQLMCGLGWDVIEKKGGFWQKLTQSQCDLDASVLCLDERGKLKTAKDVLYFGNLRHYSDAIAHLGDNLTGKGDGDDEEIIVKLDLVPQNIHKLVFVVNIYQAFERKQDFGQIKNAFVRLVNSINNTEIARYRLSGEEYQGKTGMIMAEITRQGDDWEMTAKGEGLKVKSLNELTRVYT
jgi:stress response protein SCP2